MSLGDLFCIDLEKKSHNPFIMNNKITRQSATFLAVIFLSLSGKAQINALPGKQAVGNSQNISLLKENNSTNHQSSKGETPISSQKGTENRAMRDLFTKHFNNGDGTYTAIIGSGPVHYYKNQEYQDIDDKIVANNSAEYPFANKTNVMESFFGASATNGILSKTAEGSLLEFTQNRMYWEINGQPLSSVSGGNVPVRIYGNRAVYKDIFNGIDAEFIILGGARKLNYILKNDLSIANAPLGAKYLVFSEDIVLESGWNYKVTSKGILLTDSKGKLICQYENPVSHDANSAGAFLENTVMEARQTGNVLTVLTKVKTSWLLNSNRTFPIAVDPTSVYYPNNAADASGQCFPTGGSSGDIYAGYNDGWYRGWVTFNTTGLPACTISNATVSLYPGVVIGTFGLGNGLFIGQSKYDLSSLYFFPTYDGLYTAITDNPTNTGGAYAEISAAVAGSYHNFELGPFGRADIAAKAGGNDSFFSMSLSPTWGTGTTNRIMGFYGYADVTRKPFLSVTYTQSELYCHPTNINANCAGYGDCEYIGVANVSLGTINNTTTYNNTPTGYNSYTAMTTNVIPENNYTLTVTYGDNGTPVNPGNIAAWIDWDQNGTMSAAEFLGNSGTMINNQTHAFNFNVPANAPAGPTRLRVRSALTSEVVLAFGNSCVSLDYGETEDYTVTVVIPPVNDNCANVTSLIAGGTFAEHAVIGTNEFATNSTQANPACANYQGGDVWYTVSVPASGSVTIETAANSGSTLTDTGLAVYSGTCGSNTLLGCDDNSGTGNFSLVSVTGQTPGAVLYIRTWGFANLISGTFQISAWDASLGLNQHNIQIGLYPNPANTEVTVETQEIIKTVRIYNLLGQMVITDINSTVNISGLSNGIYLLQAIMENGSVATEKLIKN